MYVQAQVCEWLPVLFGSSDQSIKALASEVFTSMSAGVVGHIDLRQLCVALSVLAGGGTWAQRAKCTHLLFFSERSGAY